MFHAEMRPAKTFRQIIESLKEVVNECTFECTDSQMQVQAMDSSHVSLVLLELTSDQFHSYRCEKNIQLGVSIGNLAKMIKGANNDSIILTSEDEGDVLNIRLQDSGEEKVSEFSMKLMEIDTDSLGVPDQDYNAGVQLPSAEFARICRDLANFGDAVTIEVTKDHVSFSAAGDIGSGKIVLKSARNADQHGMLATSPTLKRAKKEEVKDEKVKREEPLMKVKKEKGLDVSQEDTNGELKVEDDEPTTRRGKRATMEKPSKLMNNEVSIDCKEPVVLQFALRYLTMFSKAQVVSDTVKLMIAPTVPLQVEFEINGNDDKGDRDAPRKKLGFLRYYLAPKVGNDDENGDADDFADA